MIRRFVWGVAVAVAVAGPAAARSLRETLGSASQLVGIDGGAAFDSLADVIANTAARNLPVVSSSAGYTYQFNPELEVFERTSETLGPIFLERPETVGRSKFNLNVSFQYVRYDAYDGEDLDRLQDPYPIVVSVVDGSGNLQGFTANALRYDLGIVNYITALSATYGVLDDLDLNIFLPLIQTSLDVGVTTQQLFIAGQDGAFVPDVQPPLSGSTDDGHFGVGDILLRSKYRLPRWGALRSAAGLQLRLPSGSEAEFQGTGSFEVSPSFFASTLLWQIVEPQLNAAIDLNATEVSQSQARYGVGVDVQVIPQLGLSLAFLGRSEFSRSDQPGATSFLHLVDGTPASKPLLGLDFGRKDFFDFSFGFRAVVWRQIMVFASGIYALNDQGLRNDTIIPTVGVEGTF